MAKDQAALALYFEVTEILKLEQEQTNLRLEGQKMVLNAILQAQEQERERISESLHNGVGQLLFAARLNLQLANSKPPGRETEAIFSKVNDLLNEAIRQSRSVSFELVPTILKDFGLQATLEDLAQRLSSPALTIHILVEGLEKRPEKFLELTIYRIIQALVGNVMEHSQAREATVQVSASGNEVVILVSDNGKGFNPATATSSHTEGDLQTVSNRVALLNGTLSIDSAPGKGTTVRVILPVSRPI
jgi:signal transduction histidine kinase